jgi:CRP-like cAMP-binding protein
VNVTANRPVAATCISRDTFMRVVGEFPDFAAKVMSVLSGKLAGSVTEFDRVRHMLESAPSFPRR